MFFLLYLNIREELYRACSDDWDDIVKVLEKESSPIIVDIFKSDKMTMTCFKDYHRHVLLEMKHRNKVVNNRTEFVAF